MRIGWRVVVGYSALAILLSWPLVRHAADSVLAGGPDTDLFLWTLGWDTHALTHGIFSIFDANITYPQRLTLAYSENLIGDVLFAAPVLWVTGNIVLTLNVVSLLTCVFCGIGTYLLARSIGVSRAGATLAGIIFAFSPPRFLRITQLHLTSVHWIPFTLAFLHKYFENGRPRDLRLAAAFFTLQALSSGHGAVFNSIAVIALVAYRIALGEPLAVGRRVRDLGVSGAMLLVPTLLSIAPYLVLQRTMNFRRSLENWAVPASTFLATPSHADASLLSMFSLGWVNENAAAWLFPGVLPLALAAAALVWWPSSGSGTRGWREPVWIWLAAISDIVALLSLAAALALELSGPFRWKIGSTTVLTVRSPIRVWAFLVLAVLVRAGLHRLVAFDPRGRVRSWRAAYARWADRHRGDARIFYAVLTLIALWLSIGPPLSVWPWVYWLPGLNLIRVPSRFTILAVLGLAVLASLGFDRLTGGRTTRATRMWAWLAGAALVAEFSVIPLGITPYPVEIPEIDRWLDSRPKPFAIAEVPLPPFGAGGAWERRQSAYMLHSMAHWQKTVHGHPSLRPALHEALYSALRTFPDEQSIAMLEQLGVTYVVVHADLYAEGEWPAVEDRLEHFRDVLHLEHVEGAGRVYALRRTLNAN
jgi:hypothetical protein